MDTFRTLLSTLSPLSDSEWQAARDCFYRETVSKGAYYLREGALSDRISFVESGLFRLFYQLDGREKIMLFFAENQLMTDYFSYLTHTPSIRPIQALEDSVLYSIRRRDLDHLMDRYAAWSKIGRLLAERAYVVSVQRANRLLHDDPATRLDTFLREYPTLWQRLPQYQIASYLDITPETLSRLKSRRRQQPEVRASVHRPLDGGLL